MKKFKFLIIFFICPFLSSHAQITVSPNNLIGINNPNPLDALDVIGNPVFGTATERLSLGSGSLGFNVRVATEAIYNNGLFGYQFQHIGSSTAANDYLALQVYQPGGSLVTQSALSINGLGQVGIGYTNNTINGITYQLAVNGSLFANSFTGNGINIQNTLNGQNGIISVGGTVTVNNNNGINPIFTINGNSYIPGGDSYWINSSGDLGIHLRMLNNGNDSYIDTYPDLFFRTGSSATSGMTHCPMYINNSGVGFNTTSVVSAVTVSGTVTCTALTQTSDARIKTNIQSMTSTLGTLIQLRAVTYNLTSFSLPSIVKMNNKNDTIGATGGSKPQGLDSIYINRSHMGFLAQEIQTIYPNLVYTDKNGLMSIDYIGVIPILVESLKEENATITTLQTTVTNLQATIASMQTAITALQKKTGI